MNPDSKSTHNKSELLKVMNNKWISWPLENAFIQETTKEIYDIMKMIYRNLYWNKAKGFSIFISAKITKRLVTAFGYWITKFMLYPR